MSARVATLMTAAALAAGAGEARAQFADIAVHPDGGVALLKPDGRIAVKKAWPGSEVSGGPHGSGPRIAMTFTADGSGAWIANSRGDVAALGSATPESLTPPQGEDIVDIAAHPSGNRFWLLTSKGGVYSSDIHPRPPFHGSAIDVWAAQKDGRAVGIAADPKGRGYWIVFESGRVVACGAPHGCTPGSLPHHGDVGGRPLNLPVVGMAADPLGRGYWLAAQDGGLFTYPGGGLQDVPFFGNQLGIATHGVAPAPWGGGYWMLSTTDAKPFGQVDKPPTPPPAPTPAAPATPTTTTNLTTPTTPATRRRARPPDPRGALFTTRDRLSGRRFVVRLLQVVYGESWRGATARITCLRCRPRLRGKRLRFRRGRRNVALGQKGHLAPPGARILIAGDKGGATFTYRYVVRKRRDGLGWSPRYTPPRKPRKG
jgi:hypothetical protein